MISEISNKDVSTVPEIKPNEEVSRKENLGNFDKEYNESFEKNQLTKQEKTIAEVESGKRELNTDKEKGNYGEMKMDQNLRERGCDRISGDMVTSLDDKGHKGIDGVYENKNSVEPKYIIADAKYGTANLKETKDGKQMSDNWIDKRLDEAVGKEKADEIRMEKLLNSNNVCQCVCKVDEHGNIRYDKLDSNANVIEKDVKFND